MEITLNSFQIMNYAYVRVSTDQQSCSSQEFEIKNWAETHNMVIDKWIKESIHGTVPILRRKLGAAIRRMKPGDLLICTEISRLGRNVLMIMSVLNYCCERDIGIRTIKDNFDLSENLNSKIIAFAFGLSAEIERNLISQRTREALADKKASGVKLGRPTGSCKMYARISLDSDRIHREHCSGVSYARIARRYGIHPNTLRRYLLTASERQNQEDVPTSI